MKNQSFYALVIAITLAVLLSASALAAPLQPLDVYPAWDADMINVEAVSQRGAGVYVAVLDSGLIPNWRDYFPEERVATELGKGFYQNITFKAFRRTCGMNVEVGPLYEGGWVGSTDFTHGTHIASTIVGYNYDSNGDAAAGYPLPPIFVRGIAPDVTIIPVRVLDEYRIPALPLCGRGYPSQVAVFGTLDMIAAGIDYATDLAIAGYRPMVINMSIVSSRLGATQKAAIDRAIANGVIVVAAAGNNGEAGMSYPGAYPPVISVGASGWIYEWYQPALAAPPLLYRLWWLQEGTYGYNDIPEPTPAGEVYVTDFSSRERPGQQLDVLAPGSWVNGPFPGDPGYNHLPWWSKGIGDLVSGNSANFYYAYGTSMAAPHVAALAALMLQENADLNQVQVESILKSTTLPIPAGSARVWDLLPAQGFYTYSWGSDATGAGLVQADAALAAVAAQP